MKILHSVILTLATASALPVAADITDPAVQQSLIQITRAAADHVFTCNERWVACDENHNVISLTQLIIEPDDLSVDMSVFAQLQTYSAHIDPDMKGQKEILPSSLAQLTRLKNLTINLPADQQSFNLPRLSSVETLALWAYSTQGASFLYVPSILSEYGKLLDLTLKADIIDFSGVNSLTTLANLQTFHADTVADLPVNSMVKLKTFSWNSDNFQAFEQYTLYLSQLNNLDAYSLSFIDQGRNTVPEHLANLSGLESLNLSKNNIEIIPGSLLNSAGLKTLNLSFNKLTALPENVINSSLENLNLSFNKITGLPESIGSWSELKSLDIHSNRVKTLPTSLSSLTMLENLDLSYNQLAELPMYLLTLPQLKQLNLKANRIQGALAEDIFLTLGANLEAVDLSNNALQGKLPDFNPNHLGKPEILLNDNALWHTDTVILNKYSSGIAENSILDSQLLPPRGVRVVERKEDWTIEWGFPLMHDTAGKHISAAYQGEGFYTSQYYSVTIEREGQEAEIIGIFCPFNMVCPTGYEANYQSFETDYKNLTAIYRYKGNLEGATISVTSLSFLGEFGFLHSSSSVAGLTAEHEMHLDELDYELQKIPELKISGGSASYALLIFLAGLRLLGRQQSVSEFTGKKLKI